MKRLFTLFGCMALTVFAVQAQCPAGQQQVYIDVRTDNYGYETYWELLPGANSCGSGTLFAGGNTSQVGCSGGGDQDASAGSGYGNNNTYTEGPWCLTEGATYKIAHVDDWGDGGAEFTVRVAGYDLYHFMGSGTSDEFTFDINLPPATDAAVDRFTTFEYPQEGEVAIRGHLKSQGTNTINSIEVAYYIGGTLTASENFTGLNLNYGEVYEFDFTTGWTASAGSYTVEARIISVNGSADMDNSNDSQSKNVVVSPAIPMFIDNYLSKPATFDVIAGSSDQVLVPRDLDFHPDLERKELWIINKSTEGSGGSTVIVHDAGTGTQTSEWRQDGNAWHFMSLPTAIAFGENGNFGTTPGVLDANHSGGSFTGPSLWTSDLSIYAVVGNPATSAFNGSHIDMLHGSPFSMGMAHEIDNIYWVYDSYNEEIVSYDFKDDHGPGQDYHGDAIVKRYTEVMVTRDSDHIPCHMVIDKETGWLYIIDNPNQQVLRLDINSGNVKASIPLINEPLTEHLEMENATWAPYITSGLVEPTGIAVHGDRLLVSDYNTGDIIIYDASGWTGTELGRIATGASEIMGITVGPEGFIWYVDAGTNTVNKISVDTQPPAGINDNNQLNAMLYPQPASNNMVLALDRVLTEAASVDLYDLQGQLIYSTEMSEGERLLHVDVSNYANGMYLYRIQSAELSSSGNFVINR